MNAAETIFELLVFLRKIRRLPPDYSLVIEIFTTSRAKYWCQAGPRSTCTF